jgi:crotonobetainyl-CoA:carnitine CoA-transferase CaiB-like acyl-CoA transferase
MAGPLSGARILDLTHVLNGPFCTMLLAHLGAEVIKVEHGSGDRFRHAWMPTDATHDGYEFLTVNSNKKGITLNLKHEKGRKLFRDLVKKSDVVVENFTVGVMDRLGLGYEALREINPKIIYACSRGYGESGPYKHVRANAATIMAMSGWQYAAQELAGEPGFKALGIGDEAAGFSMALAICAALYSREQTGKGQKIEISMQEAVMGFMVSTFHTLFEGRNVGQPPKQCADGHYAFHLPDVSDELWSKLCTAMGTPEIAKDPHFATSKARRQNYEAVEQLVSKWVRGKTRQELWDTLSSFGLSSGMVLSLEEVLTNPHIQERKAFVDIEHPEAGTIKLLAPWMRFSDSPAAITRAAPLIGQDNLDIYGSLLGLSEAEVKQLAKEGAI